MSWPKCDFCGAFITEKPATNYPSNSCQKCWLTINAAQLSQEGSNMLPRGKGLRDDYWGCYHDYDQEMAELAALKRHKCGDCEPSCAYCETEAQAKETEDKENEQE